VFPGPKFLVCRWAAKEALYKAVYPYHILRWKDIELMPVRDNAGYRVVENFTSDPPRLSAKLRATFTSPLRLTIDESTITHLKTHVSISHDGGLIVAMAVVEGA
jgi:phosphopantetheinyl transferase (holo-ACP synthase)